MPRKGLPYVKVPCPQCGSGEVKSCRRVRLEGIWPDVVLVRRYRCRRCGLTFHTYELTEGPASAGPLPSTER